jgi:hypothetical protein
MPKKEVYIAHCITLERIDKQLKKEQWQLGGISYDNTRFNEALYNIGQARAKLNQAFGQMGCKVYEEGDSRSERWMKAHEEGQEEADRRKSWIRRR